MNKAEKIAVIIAIVQIFKYYGVPHKLLPIFALLVGAILEFSENPSAQSVLDGIVLGALTTGSYGVVKGAAQTVLKTPKKEPVEASELDDDRCA